jgi:hypothetical protein
MTVNMKFIVIIIHAILLLFCFPYSEKIKAGLWDHFAACLCIHPCLSICLCIRPCLSICLCISLRVHCLCIRPCLSICLCISLRVHYLCIRPCLSICICIRPCLSICMCIRSCPSICLCIDLCISPNFWDLWDLWNHLAACLCIPPIFFKRLMRLPFYVSICPP